MSGPEDPEGRQAAEQGSMTSEKGTPMPVKATLDRQSRLAIAVLLAGPLVWAAHFMLVYTVSEAGCTGGGPGLRLLDAPVPTVVTVAATAVGALVCVATAWWAFRRWRAGWRDPAVDEAGEPTVDHEVRDLGGALAFGGFLLSLLSGVSVLMVGLPALVLRAC